MLPVKVKVDSKHYITARFTDLGKPHVGIPLM